MVDVFESESLRDSYKIKYSPSFVFMKGDKYFEYDSARNVESVKSFIE